MQRFEGAVAIVTGGGMGLGEALSEELGRRGATVVVADIDGDAARRVAERLEESGVPAVAVRVDVASEAEVAQLIGEMTAKDPAARPASAQEVATRADALYGDLVDGVAGGPASWQYSVPVTVADIPPPGPAATPDPTLGWQPPPAKRTRRLAAASTPPPPGRPAPAGRSRWTR